MRTPLELDSKNERVCIHRSDHPAAKEFCDILYGVSSGEYSIKRRHLRQVLFPLLSEDGLLGEELLCLNAFNKKPA